MCALMSSVCQSYVLACHSYVTFMYSYVIRMPLVGTRMSSLCYSYVLACHLYVTRMYSYVIRMSLVFGFTMNLLFALCFNIYFFYKNLIVLHHGDSIMVILIFYFDIYIKFTLLTIISTMKK